MFNKFPLSCDQTKLLCFVDLPLRIRRRIYILAGLVRVCPISLNTEGADKAEYLQECEEWFEDNFGEPPDLTFNVKAGMRCFYRRDRFMDFMINANADGFDCMCRSLPYALLFVSRAIHDEVSSILFSENMFRVCRSDRNGLSSLFALSLRAIKSMTSLSIRLNACSCVPNHQCPEQFSLEKECSECHYNCRLGRDRPISVTQVADQAVISEWKILARRLAKCVNPSQLKLTIICDTLDHTTAEQIVEPLLELPTLAGCAIRLGQSPDPKLHRLLEMTVLQMTSRPTYYLDQPFRFLDLPKEIQLQILGHTNLVSPNVIKWTSGRGIGGGLSCCKKCTDALEGCCCSVRHAAYTSESCSCWAMPLAIFHVNRQLHDFATQIFFSANTFKAHPSDIKPDQEDFLYVLQFLRALPTHGLPYIRRFHCVFESLANDPRGPGKEYYDNWDTAAAFISRNLTLPHLTLTIEEIGGDGVRNLMTGRDDSVEMEDLDWIRYQRLIEPLSNLQSLENLRIHLGRPRWGKNMRKYAELRQEREKILETKVMGEAYDSDAGGKFAERRRFQAIKETATANPILGPDGTQIWPQLF